MQMVCDKSKNSECSVRIQNGDAYVNIAKTAVESSILNNTTLIGNYTDLLILLLYYNISAQGLEEHQVPIIAHTTSSRT